MIRNVYFPAKYQSVARYKKEFKESLPVWWNLVKFVALKLRLVDLVREHEERFAKEFLIDHYGQTSWEDIAIRDKKVFYNATTINGFYEGYPHFTVVKNFPDQTADNSLEDPVQDLITWISANATGKWRMDLILTTDDRLSPDYYSAEQEVACVAFENKNDYVWFELTWG